MSNHEPHSEAFPTPDGPADIIVSCENCGNLVYVRNSNKVRVVDCPICGCLNPTQLPESKDKSSVDGHLHLSSLLLQGVPDNGSSERIALPQLPEEVRQSLVTLLKHGWEIRFETLKIDDENEN